MGVMAIDNGKGPCGVRDDRELVGATLSGDRRAYVELYDRYAGLIRAVCHHMSGNLTEAQDLCQEAFLRTYRSLGDLRRPERFAAWLVATAKTVCREWHRKQEREKRGRGELVNRNRSGGDPAEDDGALGDLEAAIGRLPEKERLAIHAYYLLGQSADAAGAALGLSRSGLHRRLSRARERLKVLMRHHWE
jgi:RNA polymerase sigma-70 factor (ECF subfamily)